MLNFVYLQVSLEWYQTNASASLLWPIQIYDLSPSLSSNQRHSSCDCVFVAHCKSGFLFRCKCLVFIWLFFSLCKSYFIQSCLTFGTNIKSCFHLFVFHLFGCTFSIWCLPWLTSTFSFYNLLILFILVPNFRQNWQIS